MLILEACFRHLGGSNNGMVIVIGIQNSGLTSRNPVARGLYGIEGRRPRPKKRGGVGNKPIGVNILFFNNIAHKGEKQTQS